MTNTYEILKLAWLGALDRLSKEYETREQLEKEGKAHPICDKMIAKYEDAIDEIEKRIEHEKAMMDLQ